VLLNTRHAAAEMLGKKVTTNMIRSGWDPLKNDGYSAGSPFFCVLSPYQCFRSGSGFNQVSIWIRIQEGKNEPQKLYVIKKFHVLKCWMFSFEV
jgi:hypothetical protein